MSLTKEKIEANTQKFLELNEKYEIFSVSLKEFLGEQFFYAPASTMLNLHNAFPGGLLDHLIKICKYMIQVNKLLPESMRIDEKSIFRTAFISEIGKTFLYKPCQSEWHRKNLGKLYEFNEEIQSMKIGERSAFYAMGHGVNLSEDEFAAIVNLDKSDEDKQARFFGGTLSTLLRQAIDLAIMEEKHAAEKAK